MVTGLSPTCAALQDEIFGSAYASAVYISSVLQLPKHKKVYVVGMAGIEEELSEEGIQYLGGTVRLLPPPSFHPIEGATHDPPSFLPLNSTQRTIPSSHSVWRTGHQTLRSALSCADLTRP